MDIYKLAFQDGVEVKLSPKIGIYGDMKMNRLICLNSSSSGNGYVLECDGEILIIEAGLPFRLVNKTIFYRFRNIVGCIVSHRHTDHAKYIPEFLHRTIPVYSHPDVADKYEGVIPMATKKIYNIGSFKIDAIEVQHSVPNYAYRIKHPAIGTLLFVTDAIDFPYRIKGLNHLFIEANYADEVIGNNAYQDKWSSSASNTHMEINKTIDVIKHNLSPDLRTICLLHLSDGNSDEEMFKEMVWNETGKRCYVACPDLIIKLEKEDF